MENGVGDEHMLVHRMYGAIRIDGNLYRVKTTIHEKHDKANKPHDYRVTKIELLISGSPTSDALSNSKVSDKPNSRLETYPLTKLLNGVDKSYDAGKKFSLRAKKAIEKSDADSTDSVAELYRALGYTPMPFRRYHIQSSNPSPEESVVPTKFFKTQLHDIQILLPLRLIPLNKSV